MFGIEHLTNINDSFIVVEAAQFDSYGYLFRKPFFISLDGTAQPAGLNIRGMRVGLNGAEARVGKRSRTSTRRSRAPGTRPMQAKRC